MRRPAVLCVAFATACLVGCGSTRTITTFPGPPTPASFFGINGDELYRLEKDRRAGGVGRQLAALPPAGVTFVRSPAAWADVEPAPAKFDFSVSDRFVAALARHHLRWQPIGQGL